MASTGWSKLSLDAPSRQGRPPFGRLLQQGTRQALQASCGSTYHPAQ